MQSRRPDRCCSNSPPPNVRNARDESLSRDQPRITRSSPLLQQNPQPSSVFDSKSSVKSNDAESAKSSTIRRPGATKATKHFRFSPTVRGIFFEPANDDDRQRLWYSPEEYREFREMVQTPNPSAPRMLRHHLDMYQSAKDQATLDATPTQGVENFISKNILFADQCHQQQSVIHAVLAEQQRQRVQGRSLSSLDREYESNKLALISKTLSFQSRHRALANGQHCADEVLYEA